MARDWAPVGLSRQWLGSAAALQPCFLKSHLDILVPIEPLGMDHHWGNSMRVGFQRVKDTTEPSCLTPSSLADLAKFPITTHTSHAQHVPDGIRGKIVSCRQPVARPNRDGLNLGLTLRHAEKMGLVLGTTTLAMSCRNQC